MECNKDGECTIEFKWNMKQDRQYKKERGIKCMKELN